MKLPRVIYSTGRRVRALVLPVDDPQAHLCQLVRRTGKELKMEARVIDGLVAETIMTIQESWYKK